MTLLVLPPSVISSQFARISLVLSWLRRPMFRSWHLYLRLCQVDLASLFLTTLWLRECQTQRTLNVRGCIKPALSGVFTKLAPLDQGNFVLSLTQLCIKLTFMLWYFDKNSDVPIPKGSILWKLTTIFANLPLECPLHLLTARTSSRIQCMVETSFRQVALCTLMVRLTPGSLLAFCRLPMRNRLLCMWLPLHIISGHIQLFLRMMCLSERLVWPFGIK
jgi:hypothetical protein